MESVECKDEGVKKACHIYFQEKVFGKPTKNRQEDPNMFDLLTWSG
jgi:hypothetical protein